MAFTHTTEGPSKEADEVLKMTNAIKMIVIVDDEPLAQKADNLASDPPVVIRKVIWFRNGLPNDLREKHHVNANAQAFALNINNVLKDEILAGQIADNVRIEQAYVKGAKTP